MWRRGLFIAAWAAIVQLPPRGLLRAEEAQTGGPEASEHAADAVPGDELWFPVGETIAYKIYWGRIPVARSTATTEWVEEDGRRLLAIRFRTRSNRIIGAFYPVDDYLESIIDPATFLPLRFTKQLSEGRYRCNEVTTFDHAQGQATWENRKRDRTEQYAIDADTRDLISFMYAMRTADFPVGTTQSFRVMADEEIYDLEVKALKKGKVKLRKYGKVESVLLEPKASFDGLFVRKGTMRLWVSEDERRLITRADVSVPVADVHLVLDRVTGPGEDAWVE